MRFRAPALQRQIVGEPERAGEKGRLADWEAVDRAVRLVAKDEAVMDKLALDGLDRAAHAQIGWTSAIIKRLASSFLEP